MASDKTSVSVSMLRLPSAGEKVLFMRMPGGVCTSVEGNYSISNNDYSKMCLFNSNFLNCLSCRVQVLWTTPGAGLTHRDGLIEMHHARLDESTRKEQPSNSNVCMPTLSFI